MSLGAGALIRWVAAALFLAFVAVEFKYRPLQPGKTGWSTRLISLVAMGSSLLLFVILVSHIQFPLSLEVMEGTVLQHLERAAAGQHIYTAPDAMYIALAYNPLYYYVTVPVSWLFGETFLALRLVSITAYLVCAAILFHVVRRGANSVWAGFIGVGLFAAAYRATCAHLDTAHADSCLLAAALLGTAIIDWNKSRAWNAVGVLILVSAFWFKQHGALFAIGGVLYLTWREGIARAWIYWAIAAVFGPLVYFGFGNLLFGPYFHFFTLETPSSWSVLSLAAPVRVLFFAAMNYPVLCVAAIALVFMVGREAMDGQTDRINVWHVQLIPAILSALMGSLDPGSHDNVFIPFGVWLILLGTLAIMRIYNEQQSDRRRALGAAALLTSFAAFLYDPMPYLSSFRAHESFDDLVTELKGLDGPVYAPGIGHLEAGYEFTPTANWVALGDLVRGGDPKSGEETIEKLLDNVVHPAGPAYLLSYVRPESLASDIKFLNDYYVVVKDYGDRFEPLKTLPHNTYYKWPRYLFKFQPPATDGTEAKVATVQDSDRSD